MSYYPAGGMKKKKGLTHSSNESWRCTSLETHFNGYVRIKIGSKGKCFKKKSPSPGHWETQGKDG